MRSAVLNVARSIDDHGGVLLRFDGGALGTLVFSQVAPGAAAYLETLDSNGDVVTKQKLPG